MSISSKIALAMSADGASFEEVHNSLEKLTDDFVIKFAEWKDKNCYLVMGSESLFYFRDSEIHDDAYTRKELLEIYKLTTGL